MTNDYSLPIPEGLSKKLTTGWLILSIASLLIAGLLSVLLVLSRTPYIQDYSPWVDFFHTALVVHVDLSVLIWFLSFAGVFWSINSNPRLSVVGWLALIISAAGALIMALSPFLGAGNPLMNNYVPVLQDPIFFTGLILFGAGFCLLIMRSLLSFHSISNPADGAGALQFGIKFSTIIALIAMIAFIWSYKTIPHGVQGEEYYELLFWGGGHALQFLHTMLMALSWLWLANTSGIKISLAPRTVITLFAIGLAAVLTTPFIYALYDVTSYKNQQAFTIQMQYGLGPFVLPIAFMVFVGILKCRLSNKHKYAWSALVSSMVLFGSGGIIGFLIQGTNVTIPAHYHGSIVGVTLAFMGIAYYLLPRLGFKEPSPRLTYMQPYIYGAGQLLNIVGLAWAGGYGVERKTAGSAQGLEGLKEMASMGLMGLGGLVAVIGGFLFLVIVVRSMWPEEKTLSH